MLFCVPAEIQVQPVPPPCDTHNQHAVVRLRTEDNLTDDESAKPELPGTDYRKLTMLVTPRALAGMSEKMLQLGF